MKQTAQWLVVTGVFLVSHVELGLLLLAVLLLITQYRSVFPPKLLLVLIPVWLLSLTVTWLVDYAFGKPVQQILLLTAFILLYEQFFRFNRLNLLSLFRKYIYLTYIICLIGLFQELVFMATGTNIIEYLPSYHSTRLVGASLMRITSTLAEGGNLGIAIMPALVYLFIFRDPFQILGRRKWVVLLVALLTLSPFVFIFCVVAFFWHLNRLFGRYKTLTGALVAVVVLIGVVSLDPFGGGYKSELGIWDRIGDSYTAVARMGNSRLNTVVSKSRTPSSTVLATHMYVGLHAPSRLFGTGIGTHPQSYAALVRAKYRKTDMNLNVDDGYALFNRILSEFGFVGLLLYVVFLIRFFNKDNMINVCFLSMMLCLFLRGGNYVLYGTVFAHFFYGYTARFKLSAT